MMKEMRTRREAMKRALRELRMGQKERTRKMTRREKKRKRKRHHHQHGQGGCQRFTSPPG